MARDVGAQERIKQLNSRLQKMNAELETLEEEKKEAQRNYDRRKEQRNQLYQELENLKKHEEAEPTVSEHAILRYMERAMGYDLDQLRENILEGRREEIDFIGSGEIRTSEGYALVIRNKNVVTVK